MLMTQADQTRYLLKTVIADYTLWQMMVMAHMTALQTF